MRAPRPSTLLAICCGALPRPPRRPPRGQHHAQGDPAAEPHLLRGQVRADDPLDDFWLFCALLFPAHHHAAVQAATTQGAVLWGQLIVLFGSFLAITNPPSYDYLQYINSSLGQALG